MVIKEIANFNVKHVQILDESGKVDNSLMPKISDDQLKQMYEIMILVRAFDKKALSLQRQGRLGTYPMFLGQEASQIGSAYALENEDWTFASYRETAMLIARNISMKKMLQYWGGDERGSQDLGPNFPISIPVGSQPLHAVGAGIAFKMKKQKKVAVTYFGDGATSKGDVHESMNFAGVFSLPVVFICQNNQFAISTSRKNQTGSETIAQKAIAYGFEGIQVDGNDVLAVYKATKDALDKARSGRGPTLIECLTYRIADHTTSDDAQKYRTKEEVEKWQKLDPVERLRLLLLSKKLWTQDYEDKLQNKCKEDVEKAVKEFETEPLPPIDGIFKFMYKEMPPELQEQLSDLTKRESSKIDKEGEQ